MSNCMFNINKKNNNALEVAIEYLRQEVHIESKNVRDLIEAEKNVMIRHVDNQSNWQQSIEAKLTVLVSSCPEASHIAKQNGKLDRAIEEIATTRGNVRFWCYAFSAILTVLTVTVGIFTTMYSKGGDVEPKDVLEELQDKLVTKPSDVLSELIKLREELSHERSKR